MKLIPKDIGQVYPDWPGLDLMELPLHLENELFLEHSSFAYFDITGPVKQEEIKVDIHLKSVLQGVI